MGCSLVMYIFGGVQACVAGCFGHPCGSGWVGGTRVVVGVCGVELWRGLGVAVVEVGVGVGWGCVVCWELGGWWGGFGCGGSGAWLVVVGVRKGG